MNNNEKIYTGCLILVLAIFTLPIVAVLNGFAIGYMWGWFFVEKFGLPSLSMAEAILVASLVGFATTNIRELKAGDNKDAREKLVNILSYLLAVIIRPAITLAFFYIVMLFL